MARHRSGVVAEYAGGTVYVKRHPSRAGYFKVCYRDRDGVPREDLRKGEDPALKWAGELALRVGLTSGTDPLWALVHHMLHVEPSPDWSSGYVGWQESLARTWLSVEVPRPGRQVHGPLLEVPCDELGQEQFEKVVAELRKAGRAPSTENQVRGLIDRLVAHGRRWGFLSRGVDLEIRTPPRSTMQVRMVGDDNERIYRDELPPWDSLFKIAQAAAELTGVWWEELRVLILCAVGARWGEHCLWRADDFGLFGLTDDLDDGEVRVFGKVDENTYARFVEDLYGTKNRTRRITAHPAELDELLARRYAEVGPGGIMFPTTYGLLPCCRKAAAHVCGTPAPAGWDADAGLWPCYASRSAWRQQVFLRAGQAVGWPVKAVRAAEKGRKAPPRVSSLAWTEHDFRHVAATMLLDPPGDRWWHGRGLTLPDVAYALGDTVETIQRTYIGRSEFSRERVRSNLRG